MCSTRPVGSSWGKGRIGSSNSSVCGDCRTESEGQCRRTERGASGRLVAVKFRRYSPANGVDAIRFCALPLFAVETPIWSIFETIAPTPIPVVVTPPTEAGEPRVGVTSVGLVAKTKFPLPVVLPVASDGVTALLVTVCVDPAKCATPDPGADATTHVAQVSVPVVVIVPPPSGEVVAMDDTVALDVLQVAQPMAPAELIVIGDVPDNPEVPTAEIAILLLVTAIPLSVRVQMVVEVTQEIRSVVAGAVANPLIVLLVVAPLAQIVWALAAEFDNCKVPAALLSVPARNPFVAEIDPLDAKFPLLSIVALEVHKFASPVEPCVNRHGVPNVAFINPNQLGYISE